jgi:hypothetical protein
MQANNLLEEFDRDHAVQELAAEVAGDKRAGFLKRAGAGPGALVAGSAFIGAMPKIADAAAIPASDVATLNLALTLEYLEAAFERAIWTAVLLERRRAAPAVPEAA